MDEPMTKRGQAFIAKWTDEGEYVFGRDLIDAIIAIEAEAQHAVLDELEAWARDGTQPMWRTARLSVLEWISRRRP